MFQNFQTQMAPRRNYRDIPAQYDRMGQQAMNPLLVPQNFGGWGGALQSVGVDPLTGLPIPAACGAFGCCVPDLPTKSYPRIVGLPRICIPGCDCETVETSVCGPFTMTWLYVAPKAAHFLSITRLQVGCNNLLVNCDPIPAELFSCCDNTGESNAIVAPPVDSNSPICIEFENEAQKEVELKAAIGGLLCSSC